MSAKPKFICIYLDTEEAVNYLSDEDRGKLFSLLYHYANTGEKPDVSDNPALAIAFSIFSKQIERDFNEYNARVTAQRANGKKGGAPKGNSNAKKQPNSTQNNPSAEKTTQTTEEKDKDKDKNKEKYEEKYKEEYKDKKANASAADADLAVLTAFNRICRELPKAGVLSDNRRLMIHKARSQLNRVSFEEYFRHAAASDFLTGRSGKWRGCTFDWLIRPDTVVKVLDGVYDNRTARVANKSSPSYDIEELEKIDTLDFVDDPDFGN